MPRPIFNFGLPRRRFLSMAAAALPAWARSSSPVLAVGPGQRWRDARRRPARSRRRGHDPPGGRRVPRRRRRRDPIRPDLPRTRRGRQLPRRRPRRRRQGDPRRPWPGRRGRELRVPRRPRALRQRRRHPLRTRSAAGATLPLLRQRDGPARGQRPEPGTGRARTASSARRRITKACCTICSTSARSAPSRSPAAASARAGAGIW